MNNTFSFGEYRWFTGLVINVNDPKKYGRVKVCVFGYNITSEKEFQYAIDYAKKNFDSTLDPDDQTYKEPNSYWASVVLPTTSAGMSGIGINHGLKPGSTVTGWFADGANAQQPIVNGVIAGNALPLVIPTPPAEIKEPKDVGRSKTAIGKPADPSIFGSDISSDLNRIAINENIDKTIIKWREDSRTRSKSAFNVRDIINKESKKMTDKMFSKSLNAINKEFLTGSAAINTKMNLLNGLIDSLKTNVVNKITGNIATQINKSLNPEKILDNTLKKINIDAKSAQASQVRDTMRVLKLDACFVKGFADKIVSAVEQKLIGLVFDLASQYIGDSLPDITSIKHLVEDVDATIAITEARVLGTLANGVAGATEMIYGLEDKLVAPINKEIMNISESMASSMDSILAEIVTAEDATKVAELSNKFSELMNITNKVAGITGNINNIMKTDFLGEFKKIEDQITGIPDDIVSSYADALKNLNLSNLGC